MKKTLFLLLFILSGCLPLHTLSNPEHHHFYEREYALPDEARKWAEGASLEDLCQGTKDWRHEHIRKAALHEITTRNIDTRQCYYVGMELTP